MNEKAISTRMLRQQTFEFHAEFNLFIFRWKYEQKYNMYCFFSQ